MVSSPKQHILAFKSEQPSADCIAIFHKYRCYIKHGSIITNMTMTSLRVYYWYVQTSQYGYMEHGLECIMFYIKKHMAPLAVCCCAPLVHNRLLGAGTHFCEKFLLNSHECILMKFHFNFKHFHSRNYIWNCQLHTLQWCHNVCDGISIHWRHDCLLNHLLRHRSKKTSKLHVTGLCEGNPPVTGASPSQRASNVENVSSWSTWVPTILLRPQILIFHPRECPFISCMWSLIEKWLHALYSICNPFVFAEWIINLLDLWGNLLSDQFH